MGNLAHRPDKNLKRVHKIEEVYALRLQEYTLEEVHRLYNQRHPKEPLSFSSICRYVNLGPRLLQNTTSENVKYLRELQLAKHYAVQEKAWKTIHQVEVDPFMMGDKKATAITGLLGRVTTAQIEIDKLMGLVQSSSEPNLNLTENKTLILLTGDTSEQRTSALKELLEGKIVE